MKTDSRVSMWIKKMIASPGKMSIGTLLAVALVIAFNYARLPDYEPITYDKYMNSYEANINNYYWSDIPLQKGVWTYSISYHSEHDLLTRVYPVNEDIDNAWVMYGIKESLLPATKNSVSFTIYVIDDLVLTGVEVRGMTGSEYYASDVPDQISFVFRPLTTLVYQSYRPVLTLLLAYTFYWFFVAMKRQRSAEEKAVRWLLVALIIVISTPLFMNGVFNRNDLIFHMRRIDEIANGLARGEFPVRMHTGFSDDYGSPTGILYPDLFLYFPAILHLLKLPLWKCMQIFLFAINIATVIISYFCYKEISGDEKDAVMCSALYSLSLWYLTDVYWRGAIAEALAMSFLPMVVLGFWCLCDDRYKEAVKYLVIGYSGLVQTHILTAIMTLFFSVLVFIFGIRVFLKKERFTSIISAAVLSLAINAFTWVPFLDFYIRNDVYGSGRSAANIQEGAVVPAQLLMLFPNNRVDANFFVRADGVAGEQNLSMGLALLIVLTTSFFICVTHKERDENHKKLMAISLLSVIAVWMSLDSFPYVWLEKHIPLLFLILAKNIQFAVRYHTVSSCLMVTCYAVMFKIIQAKQSRFLWYLSAVLIILSACQSMYLMSGWINSGGGMFFS